MNKLIALALIAALALGCGAGGSLAGGGIGGSGISSGAVTAFGSIFVTGTEYDTNGAAIMLERVASPASALRLGMVVVVEGDRTGATGTAARVTYDDEIEGPITAITVVSLDEKRLAILGQVVTIERTLTRFDASGVFTAPDFDTIAVNDLVEVSGFRRAADIQATYVEKKGVAAAAANASVELKGTVSGVAGRSFTIGTILVSWTNATTLDGIPSGGPRNDDFVEVEGTLTNATTVSATRIEREGAFSGNVADFEIEGTVTQFSSLSSFRVDGELVNASGAGAQFEPNNPAFVRDGVRVEVEGSLVNGTLNATKVKQRDGEARVHAEIPVGGVNAAANTVQLLGITIRADASTQFEDKLLSNPNLRIADLVAVDFLEVRGVEDGAGGILATQIERQNGPDDVRLRGSVSAIDANPVGGRSVSIVGAVVPTGASTQFSGFSGSVNDENDFYAAVKVGDLLDAEDQQDGVETAIDVADEISFETP
jgi:hypothetical protein